MSRAAGTLRQPSPSMIEAVSVVSMDFGALCSLVLTQGRQDNLFVDDILQDCHARSYDQTWEDQRTALVATLELCLAQLRPTLVPIKAPFGRTT